MKKLAHLRVDIKHLKLTNPKDDLFSVGSSCGQVSENHHWSTHLGKGDCLRSLGEDKFGVLRPHEKLSGCHAVCNHLGSQYRIGPECLGEVERFLVEDVVVSEKGVFAAQTGIVFQDIVLI